MNQLQAQIAAQATFLTPERLLGMRCGIEKESLRTQPSGALALTPHPLALGSALTHPNITTDFSRFDFNARDELKQDPANTLRFQHLAELNRWRNIAAHQTVPILPPPALTLASIQAWQNSCAGLAVSLDQITYNQLRRKLKRRPW